MFKDPFKIAFGEPSPLTHRESPNSGSDRLFEKAFGQNNSLSDGTAKNRMYLSGRFVRIEASLGRGPLEFGESVH